MDRSIAAARKLKILPVPVLFVTRSFVVLYAAWTKTGLESPRKITAFC